MIGVRCKPTLSPPVRSRPTAFFVSRFLLRSCVGYAPEASMRAGVACLIALVIATPAFGQDSASSHDNARGRLFWSGLALGVAGVTTSVLGVTVKRVDD